MALFCNLFIERPSYLLKNDRKLMMNTDAQLLLANTVGQQKSHQKKRQIFPFT